MLTLKAYAKVNLVLEVLGRRNDGYHEIASIVQTVGLHDVLSFDDSGEIEFSCSVPGLQTGDNLVLKAVRALQETTGKQPGARIVLEKKIPQDSGLGGGSSDAAAALKGLNRLWGLGFAPEKLAEIAAGIGSDVPFFIYGGTCLAEGRGERITPLPDIRGIWFVLFRPGIPVPVRKTAALYGMLKSGHYSGGGSVVRAAELLKNGETVAGMFYNTFDSVAAVAYEGLQRYMDSFARAGGGEIHLAGSGPSLFSAFGSREDALAVQGRLRQMNMDSFLAQGVDRDEAGY